MMRRIIRILGVLILLGGLIAFLSPNLKEWYVSIQSSRIIAEFEAHYPASTAAGAAPSDPDASAPQPTEPQDDPLWDAFQAYNENLYATGQKDMTDAWVFAQNPFVLQMEDNLFGFIEIPSINVREPLYLGASQENLWNGAAVLGQSSVPIGGINTNSVIAGHRGYNGTLHFIDIEDLQIGDSVYVTNPWGTLEYRAESIAVIDPYEIEAVYIQPGRDMITLSTCHPYGSGGRCRYLVYCDRIVETPEDEPAEADPFTIPVDTVPIYGIHYSVASEKVPLSADDIHQERILRWVGAGVIGVLLILLALPTRKKKKTSDDPYGAKNDDPVGVKKNPVDASGAGTKPPTGSAEAKNPPQSGTSAPDRIPSDTAAPKQPNEPDSRKR